MEDEINYLSEKVEELNEKIYIGISIDFTSDEILQLKREKRMLERMIFVMNDYCN